MLIDGYGNIHTKHRANMRQQNQVVHMTALLVKVVDENKAVLAINYDSPLSKYPVDISILHQLISKTSHLYQSHMLRKCQTW